MHCYQAVESLFYVAGIVSHGWQQINYFPQQCFHRKSLFWIYRARCINNFPENFILKAFIIFILLYIAQPHNTILEYHILYLFKIFFMINFLWSDKAELLPSSQSIFLSLLSGFFLYFICSIYRNLVSNIIPKYSVVITSGRNCNFIYIGTGQRICLLPVIYSMTRDFILNWMWSLLWILQVHSCTNHSNLRNAVFCVCRFCLFLI